MNTHTQEVTGERAPQIKTIITKSHTSLIPGPNGVRKIDGLTLFSDLEATHAPTRRWQAQGK